MIFDLTEKSGCNFAPAVFPANRTRPGFNSAACFELTSFHADVYNPASFALSATRKGTA